MIKFEFTLSDTDASNLIDIIQEEKVRTLSRAIENPENMIWYKNHADYLENLKQTIVSGSIRDMTFDEVRANAAI